MSRTARSAAIAALTALAAIAAMIAADLTTPAQAQSDGETAGRIAAHRLADGRTELGWEPRTNAGWGERILPRGRYLPANAAIDRWLHTTPVEVEGVEIGRIEALKRRNGGIELAFRPTGGERIEPFGNYLPSNIEVGSWRHTSEITFGAPENEAPVASAGSSLSAGWWHTCGLRETGAVECWGSNGHGRADAPAGRFSAVSAGQDHTCGLRETGAVECWGWNGHGQTDAPAGRFSAVSAGVLHTCALRETGAVECWGANHWGQADAPAGRFSALSAGKNYTCGLRETSAVECWGNNSVGQAVAPAGRFSAVSAGGDHTCGLRKTGAVECWGWNDSSQTDAPAGRFNAVSAGGWHSCGLRETGAVECWGSNGSGQTNVPEDLATPVEGGTSGGPTTAVEEGGPGDSTTAAAVQTHTLSAGGDHTCGLRETGAVECWGRNGHGQTDAPAGRFSAVSAGGVHTCGLREAGAIECWGSNAVGQTDTPAGQFSAVSADGGHTCGLRETGAVECWGANWAGQTVAPAGQFSAVSAGDFHTCGLRETGAVECWGRNNYGETVAPAGQFSAVSAGWLHSCGLRETGAVECWGNNGYGQTDAPAGRFSAVSAGWSHTCGLRETGAVECWGSNSWGKADAPAGRFSAVSAGDSHTCGLRETGAVECWGSNNYGQAVAPNGIENEAPIFADMIEPQTWVLGERISLELPRAHGGSGGITYSVIRRASGAVAEWRGSGPLPGITFDEDAHQLHGVAIGPVGAGYSIELKATDANGAIERMSFTVELVEPQQAVEPDAARRIAKAYAPVLLRDRNEKFKPVAINAMLEQSALVQDGRDSPLHSIGDVLEVDLLRYNGRDMHLDLFHGRSGTNEKEWAKVQAQYPATVYARVFLQDGQHLIVQYWFFYVYNNGPGGGVGEDHEGDWEGIQLVFPSGASHPLLTGETMTTLLRPTWLGYASHNHGDMYLSGEVRWRTYSGLASRPVVYVAEGSHASYAYPVASRAGLRDRERDYDIARGDHPTGLVEGETYHLEMINGDEWWLAWTGTWGKDHIRGPMVQGRRWSTPICWPGWRVVSERYAATFNTLRDC